MSSRYNIIAVTAATACISIASPLARPQNADTAAALEEITVTATKAGAISVQSAPFTIQAIGEDAIADGKLQGFDDYSKLVPGLATLNKGPDQTQIMIRGVTAGRVSHAEPQNQSTSGLYIDETPVAANAFNPDLDLFDVNRIEVLKGPQGTLFGAGAESGAIRIITNDVDLRGSGAAVSVTGSTIDGGGTGYGGHGMVNMPVTDMFGVRATAYYTHEGGYIQNVYPGGKSDYNDYSTRGGRIKGLWRINDQLEIKTSVIYQKLTSDGRPQMFTPGDAAIIPRSGTGAPLVAPGEAFSLTGPYQVVKFAPDPFGDQFTLSNMLIEYDLGAGIRLESSTSYLNRRFENTLDDTYRTRLHFGPTQLDGVTPLISPAFDNDTNVNDIAQEVRLSRKLDSGFTWVAGLYYQHHDIHFVQSDVTPGLTALWDQGIAPSFGGPPLSTFGAQPNSIFDGVEGDTQQQYAAFGDATIPVASRLDFVAGLRWFHYKQDSGLRYSGIANDGITTRSATTEESGATPKAQLTFHASEDATVYLQAAKGFRLGGVTEPVPFAGVFGTNCAADLAAVGLVSVPATFNSDHLWSYELGAKTRWLEHRLVFNASVFDIEWSNIQTNVFLPCGFITVVNAGKVRSRGAEAEISWAAFKGLTLSASAAYTNATLIEKTAQFSAQTGDRVPNVPRFNGDVAAAYRRSIGASKSVYVRADAAYIGDSFTEFNSLVTAKRVPSSTSVDASFGLTVRNWDASLYGKNLANRLIVTGVDIDRNVPATYSIAPPRTIGLELRGRF